MRSASRVVGAAMAMLLAMVMLVSMLASSASAQEVAEEPAVTEVEQVQAEEPVSATEEVVTAEAIDEEVPVETPEPVVTPPAAPVEEAPLEESPEVVVPEPAQVVEQPAPATVPGPEPPAEMPPVQEEEVVDPPAEEQAVPQVEYSTEAYPGNFFGFGALNAAPIDFAPGEIYPYTATINGDGKFINSFSNVIAFPVGGVEADVRNTEEYIICTPKDLTITITDRDGQVVGEVIANAAKEGTFTRQCNPFEKMTATVQDDGDGTGNVSVGNASDFALQAYVTVNGTGEVVDVPAQTTITYEVNEPGSVKVQAYDQNGPREVLANGEVKASEPEPDPFDSVEASVVDNGDGTGLVAVVNGSDQSVQVQVVINDVPQIVNVPAGETATVEIEGESFVTVRVYDADNGGAGRVLTDGKVKAFVPPPHPEPNPGDEYTNTPKYPDNVVDKVTFCHATGSESNAYVQLTTSTNAFYQAGHHTHQDERDIVPPFSTETQGKDRDKAKYRNFDGLNYGEGAQEFIDNDCKDVDEEPKPEPDPDPKPQPEPGDPKDPKPEPQPEDPKDPVVPKPEPEDPKDPQPEDPKKPVKDGKDDEKPAPDNKQAEPKDDEPAINGRGHNVQGAVAGDSSLVLAPALMGLGLLLLLGAAARPARGNLK